MYQSPAGISTTEYKGLLIVANDQSNLIVVFIVKSKGNLNPLIPKSAHPDPFECALFSYTISVDPHTNSPTRSYRGKFSM